MHHRFDHGWTRASASACCLVLTVACSGQLLLEKPEESLPPGTACGPARPRGACADGGTCVAGACVGACGPTQLGGVCGDPARTCVAGVCAPIPCSALAADGYCAPGSECNGDTCVAKGLCSTATPDGACPPGEICVNGACAVQPPCSATEPLGYCPPGQACVAGACSGLPACSVSFPTGACAPGERCVAGTCTPDPCTPSTRNGSCVDPETFCNAFGNCEGYVCSAAHPGGTCPAGEGCNAGTCEALACSPAEPLGTCAAGTCIVDPAEPLFGTCQVFCDPSAPSGWCPTGKECILGTCDPVCASGVRCGASLTCCAAVQDCVAGACMLQCAAGTSRCAQRALCCDDAAEVCYNSQCFLAQAPCVDHSDCLNDSYCDCPAGTPCNPPGTCVPYTGDPTGPKTNPDCSNLVVVGVFAPEHQCEWTGPTDTVPHCPNNTCAPGGPTCVDDGLAPCKGCRLCIGCPNGTECAGGETCDGGVCRRACPVGDECLSNETCVTGACRECSDDLTDSDCRGGLRCVNGYCADVFVDHVRVLSTADVVDFDIDDDPTTFHPSVVFVATNHAGGGASDCQDQGVIRVLDGRDCTTQYIVNRRRDDLYDATAHLAPASRVGTYPDARGCNSVAIADLDGSSPIRAEIVAHAATATVDSYSGGLVSFRYAPLARGGRGAFAIDWHSTEDLGGGNIIWDTHCAGAGQWWAGPSVYDLSGDGTPEPMMAGYTYDNNGSFLPPAFPGYATSGAGNCNAYGVGVFPIVADLDGDGSVEFSDGGQSYRWTGTAWDTTTSLQSQNTSRGNIAVADFGTYDAATDDRTTRDGIAEIVKVRSGSVSLQDLSGRIVNYPATATSFVVNLGGGTGGPPTVADFDGDCRAEIAVAAMDYFSIYDPDCNQQPPDLVSCNGVAAVSTCATYASTSPLGILWRVPSQDHTSSVTGSSVFDFEGDSRAEAIYADECFTRVYDGITGAVIYSQYRSSCTWYENPIVADVDGDFNAEVVVGSNTNCNVSCTGSTEEANPGIDSRRVDASFGGLPCESDADCVGGAGACACRYGRDNTGKCCRYGVDALGDCLAGTGSLDAMLGLCTCTSDTDCGSAASFFICANRVNTPEYDFVASHTPNQVCRAYYASAFNGLLVYRDVLDRWVDTRRIWSQHAYSITHINENGSPLPAASQNWAQPGLNNFRQNVLGNLNPEHSPDLTAGSGANTCSFDESGPFGVIDVSVCNRGTTDVADVPVAFYAGDPAAGGLPLCILQTGVPLGPGECIPLRCRWPNAMTQGTPNCPLGVPVYVRADDDGSGGLGERECIEGNNTAILP